MANWSDLKASVSSIIKTNGAQEITGQLLQNVLNNIISNVGANSTFAGIATPDTNPGTPDGNVFYLATTAGTYSNFNGIVINSGEAVIIEWRGSWVKKDSGFATQEKLTELYLKSVKERKIVDVVVGSYYTSIPEVNNAIKITLSFHDYSTISHIKIDMYGNSTTDFKRNIYDSDVNIDSAFVLYEELETGENVIRIQANVPFTENQYTLVVEELVPYTVSNVIEDNTNAETTLVSQRAIYEKFNDIVNNTNTDLLKLLSASSYKKSVYKKNNITTVYTDNLGAINLLLPNEIYELQIQTNMSADRIKVGLYSSTSSSTKVQDIADVSVSMVDGDIISIPFIVESDNASYIRVDITSPDGDSLNFSVDLAKLTTISEAVSKNVDWINDIQFIDKYYIKSIYANIARSSTNISGGENGFTRLQKGETYILYITSNKDISTLSVQLTTETSASSVVQNITNITGNIPAFQAQKVIFTCNTDEAIYLRCQSDVSDCAFDVNLFSAKTLQKGKEKNIITVNNAEEFISAIDFIATSGENNKASKHNRYKIYLNTGEYELYPYLKLNDIKDQAIFKRGVEIPDYVDLEGIGNVTISCTLPDSESDENVQAISTLNLYGENTLRNLKIIAKNCRYAVHDDSYAYCINRVKRYLDCEIRHEGNTIGAWTSQAGLAAVGNAGCTLIIDGCTIYSQNANPQIGHNVSQSHQLNKATYVVSNTVFERGENNDDADIEITTSYPTDTNSNLRIVNCKINKFKVTGQNSGWNIFFSGCGDIEIINENNSVIL